MTLPQQQNTTRNEYHAHRIVEPSISKTWNTDVAAGEGAILVVSVPTSMSVYDQCGSDLSLALEELISIGIKHVMI